MTTWREGPELRAKQYALRSGRVIDGELGFGYDGIVFSTTCQSAIKALRYELLYQRERDVYLRIEECCVTEVCGFKIPKLLHADDELWVVEMEIVSPPFVLDFAGAYLDFPPDFPDDVMDTWRAQKKEQYGADWPKI